jgi:hypothetical protein
VAPHENLEQVRVAASHPVDDLFITEISGTNAREFSTNARYDSFIGGGSDVSHERSPSFLELACNQNQYFVYIF